MLMKQNPTHPELKKIINRRVTCIELNPHFWNRLCGSVCDLFRTLPERGLSAKRGL